MRRGRPSRIPITREELQAHADAMLSMAQVGQLRGVSRSSVAGWAKRLGVSFPKKRRLTYAGRSPEGEARRVAGVKAMWADPVRHKAARQKMMEGKRRKREAREREKERVRAMNHPDYVYRPRTDEQRARIAAGVRKRLGLPDGYRKLGGALFTLADYEFAKSAYYRVRGRLGKEAADRFMASLAASLSEG